MAQPTRIVTDTMAGLRMPDFDIWSERVSTVLAKILDHLPVPAPIPISSAPANDQSSSTRASALMSMIRC